MTAHFKHAIYVTPSSLGTTGTGFFRTESARCPSFHPTSSEKAFIETQSMVLTLTTDNHPLTSSFLDLLPKSRDVASFKLALLCQNLIKTRKHWQSYPHADPRRQRPHVAQRHISMWNTRHGH